MSDSFPMKGNMMDKLLEQLEQAYEACAEYLASSEVVLGSDTCKTVYRLAKRLHEDSLFLEACNATSC